MVVAIAGRSKLQRCSSGLSFSTQTGGHDGGRSTQQQPVERHDDLPQRPVERRDGPVHYSERGKGLDSMMVAAPVPASQLPDVAQPQAAVGGDGVSPQQGSAQDAAPVDYDG